MDALPPRRLARLQSHRRRSCACSSRPALFGLMPGHPLSSTDCPSPASPAASSPIQLVRLLQFPRRVRSSPSRSWPPPSISPPRSASIPRANGSASSSPSSSHGATVRETGVATAPSKSRTQSRCAARPYPAKERSSAQAAEKPAKAAEKAAKKAGKRVTSAGLWQKWEGSRHARASPPHRLVAEEDNDAPHRQRGLLLKPLPRPRLDYAATGMWDKCPAPRLPSSRQSQQPRLPLPRPQLVAPRSVAAAAAERLRASIGERADTE